MGYVKLVFLRIHFIFIIIFNYKKLYDPVRHLKQIGDIVAIKYSVTTCF